MGSNLVSSAQFRDVVGGIYDRMMVFAGNANLTDTEATALVVAVVSAAVTLAVSGRAD